MTVSFQRSFEVCSFKMEESTASNKRRCPDGYDPEHAPQAAKRLERIPTPIVTPTLIPDACSPAEEFWHNDHVNLDRGSSNVVQPNANTFEARYDNLLQDDDFQTLVDDGLLSGDTPPLVDSTHTDDGQAPKEVCLGTVSGFLHIRSHVLWRKRSS